MTPWQDERWATAPTNDGKNFAPAHRWAVVAGGPLCYGLRKRNYHAAGMPCGDCDAYDSCPYARLELRKWANGEARTAALLRCYIREAHELRHRIKVMKWLLKSRHVMGEAFDRVRHRKMQILLDRVATIEAENAALRQNQPRCPDCGHRLDTEECGCLRADAGAIQTDDECNAALVRIEKLWGAKTGTPYGDELDAILDSVVAYEAAHHRVPEPAEGGDA